MSVRIVCGMGTRMISFGDPRPPTTYILTGKISIKVHQYEVRVRSRRDIEPLPHYWYLNMEILCVQDREDSI